MIKMQGSEGQYMNHPYCILTTHYSPSCNNFNQHTYGTWSCDNDNGLLFIHGNETKERITPSFNN